jgi:predicted TIM-barrel fold metal-dependent hydrolase
MEVVEHWPDITDSHVHLWDLSALRYPWLTDQYNPNLAIGNYQRICSNYLLPQLRQDAALLPLRKIVHIAAAIGHPDPTDETRFIQAHADSCGFPVGIVAHIDFRSTDVEAQLERHARYPSFRGVRALSFGNNIWTDPVATRSLERVQGQDLVYELDVQFPHYRSAAEVARRYEYLRIVVDHAGMPTGRSRDHYQAWRDGMRKLAAAPNVACKISGLGTYDHAWTIASLRPWVETILELFGPERSMLASDWPVGSLYSTYQSLFNAYQAITVALSAQERQLVFGRTADTWYRI